MVEQEPLAIIFGDVHEDTKIGLELDEYRKKLKPVWARLRKGRLQVVVPLRQANEVADKLRELGFRRVMAREVQQWVRKKGS